MKDPTNFYMTLAKMWASRSTCTSKYPTGVGCVLVDLSGRVVASGYNGMPTGMPHCDDLNYCAGRGHAHIHAELNAVIQCATSGVSCKDTVAYCTHSPCIKCAMMLYQAGIVRIVYGEPTPEIDEVRRLIQRAGIGLQQFQEGRFIRG